MHPWPTNKPTRTYDVHRFSFEAAGALEFDNEYSGHAAVPAFYIAFAELEHRRSSNHQHECAGGGFMKPLLDDEFTAFIGTDC